jgi:hypothetical protein
VPKPPPSDTARLERAQASIDFIDQVTGTLPETISERDLETLNAGLRFLFADLRAAYEMYQRHEGHDRDGVVKALAAFWRFVAMFAQPLSDNLHVPIVRLQDALQALDDNHVEPMLQPVSHRGRAKLPEAYAALRGQVAGAVMRLMQASVPQLQACAEVAEVLAVHGVRPQRGGQRITATTVRHWCDDVSGDVGRDGVAATVFDSMFTEKERERFADLPSRKKQRSFALESLARFLRAVFPAIKDAPKPTSSRGERPRRQKPT